MSSPPPPSSIVFLPEIPPGNDDTAASSGVYQLTQPRFDPDLRPCQCEVSAFSMTMCFSHTQTWASRFIGCCKWALSVGKWKKKGSWWIMSMWENMLEVCGEKEDKYYWWDCSAGIWQSPDGLNVLFHVVVRPVTEPLPMLSMDGRWLPSMFYWVSRVCSHSLHLVIEASGKVSGYFCSIVSSEGQRSQ